MSSTARLLHKKYICRNVLGGWAIDLPVPCTEEEVVGDDVLVVQRRLSMALSYINFDSSYLLESNFILLFPNGQFLICLNLAFVALKYALLLPFTAQIYNFASHILLGQKNAVFLSSSMAEPE